MNKTSKLTELDKSIINLWKSSDTEKEMLICNCLAVREYCLEADVQAFLDGHPDVTFMELDDFITSLCPPLEIVDDDELDDDE